MFCVSPSIHGVAVKLPMTTMSLPTVRVRLYCVLDVRVTLSPDFHVYNLPPMTIFTAKPLALMVCGRRMHSYFATAFCLSALPAVYEV